MKIWRSIGTALFILTTIYETSAATNYVLNLRSSADYVQVPDNNSLDLISNFTLEAWINPSSIVNQERAVISKSRNMALGGTGVELRTFGKGVGLGVNNDPGNGTGINLVFGGGDTLATNSWHHIAATYDGTTGKIYIDGILVAANLFSVELLNGATPLTIGQKELPGGPVGSFLGLIDEVRVWTRALSQEEIRVHMSRRWTGQESNLVGYWNFDDRTACDSSVLRNSGTLMGNAQIIEDTVGLSHVNLVLSLQNQGDHVSIRDSDSLDLEDRFTMEAWVNASSFSPTANAIISKQRLDGGNGYRLQLNTTGKPGIGINDGTGQNFVVESPDRLTLSNWYHLAATYDGSVFKVFVDGVQKKSFAHKVKLQKSGFPIYIGKEETIPQIESFIGQIDEVRIWNRPLSQTEIQSRMHAILGGTETGLVGYWNFDDGSANDLSLHNNDGALSAKATIIPGSSPSAIQIFTAVEIVIPGTFPASMQQLQYTIDLNFPTWVDFGEPFVNAGAEFRIFDTTRDGFKKYYRVITR